MDSKSKKTIDYLRLEPALNGFIISYSEKTSAPSKNTYDNCQWTDKKEVFDIDDTDGSDEKPFTRFKELAMRQYKEMNS